MIGYGSSLPSVFSEKFLKKRIKNRCPITSYAYKRNVI